MTTRRVTTCCCENSLNQTAQDACKLAEVELFIMASAFFAVALQPPVPTMQEAYGCSTVNGQCANCVQPFADLPPPPPLL